MQGAGYKTPPSRKSTLQGFHRILRSAGAHTHPMSCYEADARAWLECDFDPVRFFMGDGAIVPMPRGPELDAVVILNHSSPPDAPVELPPGSVDRGHCTPEPRDRTAAPRTLRPRERAPVVSVGGAKRAKEQAPVVSVGGARRAKERAPVVTAGDARRAKHKAARSTRVFPLAAGPVPITDNAKFPKPPYVPGAKATDCAEGGRRIIGCFYCKAATTPQWRNGPMGPKTLCNACGVRWCAENMFLVGKPRRR